MKAKMRITIYALFCVSFAVALASCGGSGSVPPAPSPRQANTPRAFTLASRGPRYRLVVLPHAFVPAAINDSGVIVGADRSASHTYPAEYVRGSVVDLPLLPGDTDGSAMDINNRGQVVGTSLNPAEVVSVFPICDSFACRQHAVVYNQNGQVKDLGALKDAISGQPGILSAAEFINDAGEIVGESGILAGLFTAAPLAIFAPEGVRPIIVSGYVVRGAPFGLNNAGEIVGDSGSGPYFAFPPGLAFSYPRPIVCSPPLIVPDGLIFAINNAGDTVWRSGDGSLAFCQNGISHPLPLFPISHGINDRDEIVGSGRAQETAVFSRGRMYRPAQFNAEPSILGVSRPGHYYLSKSGAIAGVVVATDTQHALLFAHGNLYDLNDLVVNNTSGLVLEDAIAINNRGEIIGSTFFSTNFTVVSWVLVPL